jgi:DHA1 family bicyclomycin/chloramphenicol resistance-like MFS transporter
VPETAYGFLFAANVAGMMAANLVNSRLVPRFGLDRIFRAGLAGAALAGLVLAATARFDLFGVAGLAVPLFLYTSMLGLVVANSVAGAMAAFPQKAGAASALLGALHYGIGALVSASIGLVQDGTPWAMGAIIGASGLAGLLACRLLHRR